MLLDNGLQQREVVRRGWCCKPYRQQAAQKRRVFMCLECREVCKVNKHCTVIEGGKVSIKEKSKQPEFEVSYLQLKRKRGIKWELNAVGIHRCLSSFSAVTVME